MSTFESSPPYAHGNPDSLGVLVVNLGTPDEPTTSAVRRYLRQFLWDPRVVEIPRPLWWLILNAFILPFRPSRSAEAYRKIWTAQGSPLLVHSLALRDEIRGRLGDTWSVEPDFLRADPDREVAETELKARVFLDAVATLQGDAQT